MTYPDSREMKSCAQKDRRMAVTGKREKMQQNWSRQYELGKKRYQKNDWISYPWFRSIEKWL